MNCEEAAEFVSALYDGERILAAAAEHVGACEACQSRLREYMEMGIEMRRAASLQLVDVPAARNWETKGTIVSKWWQKGWETMRIPRFAFGLLLAAVVILGSNLVATRARAHGAGTVVVLSIALPGGQATQCPLSAVDKKWQECAFIGDINSGTLRYQVRFLGQDGNRIELGVREAFGPLDSGENTNALADIDRVPQKQYWFEPGEKLQLDVAGLGAMEVTGEWMDHVPSLPQFPTVDPKSDELRVVSPLLLRNKEEAADLEGCSTTSDRESGVMLYVPGEGLYVFSLSPIEGAVGGSVALNRITFKMQDQNYTLLTGAPIARSEHVWVKHEEDFKPNGEAAKHPFITTVNLNQIP
jgi:hypothetical protein